MADRRPVRLVDEGCGRGRRSRRWLPAVALLLLLLAARPAAAQSYAFRVPELNLQVYVQPDASARLVYDITFENESFGQPIDIVDIGLPHDDYDTGNMRASVGGVELGDIRPSEFVDPGVEIHLGRATIGRGQRATLHFEATLPDLVYQDTTRDDYASLQITPTWFDEQFVSGTGAVQVAVHVLPGIAPDELLYQDVAYTDLAVFEEHTVAVWRFENTRPIGPRLVGVSFPQRGMSRVVEQTVLDLAVKWLQDNPGPRLFLGALSVALLGFAFFRFSGGTGLSIFVLLAGGLILALAVSPLFQLLALPLLLLLVGVNDYFQARRKPRYLPAIAQVEGGGIKRGLTAPEAAVLLELSLSKILTLVIFGLLEKGLVQQKQADPLVVELAPEFAVPDSLTNDKKRVAHRQEVAQKVGTVIRSYEHGFLDVLQSNPGRPVAQLELGRPLKQLVEGTAERLKGFDLSDTQEYYRKIIKRAMNQARAMGEIPVREQFLDEHLQWILLDDRHPTVFVAPDYSYRPVWTRPYASSGRLGMPAAPAGAGGRPSYGGKTSFGDVAASFAGWTEATMGNLASAIEPGALQVQAAQGGVVNLSGADRVTGEFFEALAKASASSGSGSSGGGGSCACACAGCACACACAGGGR